MPDYRGVKARILGVLNEGPEVAEMIASEVHKPPSVVRTHLRQLRQDGMVEHTDHAMPKECRRRGVESRLWRAL